MKIVHIAVLIVLVSSSIALTQNYVLGTDNIVNINYTQPYVDITSYDPLQWSAFAPIISFNMLINVLKAVFTTGSFISSLIPIPQYIALLIDAAVNILYVVTLVKFISGRTVWSE
ncbi:MAG: hypothetical protein NZ911_07160 [Sulfolobales archaeon]|nr:hypothetical protein [Sulfolobales archaeon]